jgi:hypothetical protein
MTKSAKISPKTKRCLIDGLMTLSSSSMANPADSSYPLDGSEAARLSLPFAVGAFLPSKTTEEGTVFAHKALSEYEADLPGLSLPAKNVDWLLSDVYRCDTALSAIQSQAIVHASKSRGLTPFHVF